MTDDRIPVSAELRFTGSAGIPPKDRARMALCEAAERLAISLEALAIAQTSSNEAPGLLGLPDEHGQPTEATELRERWSAAAILLGAAVVSVTKDGKAVINQIGALLAIK